MDGVQVMVQDPEVIFKMLQDEFNNGEPIACLTEPVKEAIVKNIKRRMTPQPLKIRADVDLTCFSYDGVLHIQVGALEFLDSFPLIPWASLLCSPLQGDLSLNAVGTFLRVECLERVC